MKNKINNLIYFGNKILKKEGFKKEGLEMVIICFDGWNGSHGFWYEKRKLITLGKDSNKRMLLHEITHVICGATKRGHHSKVFNETYDRLVRENISEEYYEED